jgi:hypothetical protein
VPLDVVARRERIHFIERLQRQRYRRIARVAAQHLGKYTRQTGSAEATSMD